MWVDIFTPAIVRQQTYPDDTLVKTQLIILQKKAFMKKYIYGRTRKTSYTAQRMRATPGRVYPLFFF